MPVYTYRREDGTTFDIKQRFADEPLTVDPATGQHVTRVVQAAGIIFKGSGFYVNDSKSASKKNISTPPSSTSDSNSSNGETKAASETKSETKTEAKAETKTETKTTPTPTPAAAD